MSVTTDSPAGFAGHLKAWRIRRRLSQLDLALRSGVSQRHVSFLESGRARPSREMILQLSETLGVPLRERNDLLLAAGFAPMFRARAFDDPQMAQAMAAVQMMLTNHEPLPALCLDRCWNVRMANAAFERFSAFLGADVWTRVGGPERNLMRLFFHPEGLRPLIANWDEIAPVLWHRARREAEAVGGEDVRALMATLGADLPEDILRPSSDTPLVPLLPVEIVRDGLRVSLFTVISTFGTAQDVTADELRIESFFPADAATAALFSQMAGA